MTSHQKRGGAVTSLPGIIWNYLELPGIYLDYLDYLDYLELSGITGNIPGLPGFLSVDLSEMY